MPDSLLVSIVVDAEDPTSLGHWWSQALNWRRGYTDDHEVDIDPPAGEDGLPLVFVPVTQRKTVPNRLHLDLDCASPAEQIQTLEHLLDLGAQPVDLGQGDVPWHVLADPEGNELCVLDPRPEYEGTGAVAAIVVQAEDPTLMVDFWALASGWDRVRGSSQTPALRRGNSGPFLEFVAGGRHRVKNRWHLDLRATESGHGRAAVIAALRAAGAEPVDIGQRDVSWEVLADPEDNEFCVLSGSVTG